MTSARVALVFGASSDPVAYTMERAVPPPKTIHRSHAAVAVVHTADYAASVRLGGEQDVRAAAAANKIDGRIGSILASRGRGGKSVAATILRVRSWTWLPDTLAPGSHAG